MIILLGLAATCATFFGGIFALKFRDKLHLILGFSAGAVIGVAFFDLLPEALKLTERSYDANYVTTFIALGFIFYLILDRTVSIHYCPKGECENPKHRGRLGAGTLSIHSFLDGIAIGLAFQVSPVIGAMVTVAVLTHDFSDGINTVSIILKNKGSREQALKWLTLDALAPLLGVLATLFFSLSQQALGLVLALFGGFFLYIGASDLLPESHHAHPTRWTTVMTVLGVMIMYVVIKLAS
ncbi:MAG: ZIP family metal transporter [Candidatus Moraniibacteriota bacterium]